MHSKPLIYGTPALVLLFSADSNVLFCNGHAGITAQRSAMAATKHSVLIRPNTATRDELLDFTVVCPCACFGRPPISLV